MVDAKPRKNADLPARIASAVVMVAVAGTTLWLGGWAWALFVAAVGLGVLWALGRVTSAIWQPGGWAGKEPGAGQLQLPGDRQHPGPLGPPSLCAPLLYSSCGQGMGTSFLGHMCGWDV